MMEWKKSPVSVTLLGGDERMAVTAAGFAGDGCPVTLWGLGKVSSLPAASSPEEAISSASLIVLPIPMTRDGRVLNAPLAPMPLPLEQIIAALRPGQIVAAGMVPPAFAEAVQKRGCRLCQYQNSEVFAIRNALATAEGAIATALIESPELLAGSSVAVLGFGRIGKQLCRLLPAMGARVTVFARKDADLTYAATMGCNALPLQTLPDELRMHKLIFNTIPVVLFDFTALGLPDDALVIDLAPIYKSSEKPRLIRASSLPAKYSPYSAGMLIHDCILSHLTESGWIA